MAGVNHDTSWKYDTDLTNHANYIVKHIMDLVYAVLILLSLAFAEFFFALLAL